MRYGLALPLALGALLTSPALAGERREQSQFQGKPIPGNASPPRLHLATAPLATAFTREVEPNDTPATAQALASTPVRVRGDLFRTPFSAGVDVDVYSFAAVAGDRVYAAVMTGFSGSSNDTVMDILASDGTTVLETDDEDGAIGVSASSIAGTVLPAAGRTSCACASSTAPRSPARFDPTTCTCAWPRARPRRRRSPTTAAHPSRWLQVAG